MEERKSMGSALVDVFDAGMVLVKSEINGVIKKVTAVAKAKGIGVVLLLGSVGPLVLGLVFLILFVFYALIRLGLGAWAAALLIALFSFALTGALIFMGIKKLGEEVDLGQPRRAVHNGELAPFSAAPTGTAAATATAPAQPATPSSARSTGTPTVATPGAHGSVPVNAAPTRTAKPTNSGPLSAAAVQDPVSDQNNTPRPQPQPHAVTPDSYERVSVEGGTTTVPVYESGDDGEAKMYGSGLNEKLKGHDHHDDPDLQNPVVLHDRPGISVSTEPTFRDDMKKDAN